MNEQEKQLYEALKTARHYLLKHIDMLQKEIKNEGVLLDIDDNFISSSTIEINSLQDNILNLQQQGADNQLVQMLREDLELLLKDIEIFKGSKKYSNYHVQKKKDIIKLYTSKINDIDDKIKNFV